MLERAFNDASDQTTPPETLLQLLSFVGHSLLALQRCAERKLEEGIPTQNISINNVTHNEARYCRSFASNAHLWGDLLPVAVERDQLSTFLWVEESLLSLFSTSLPTPQLGVVEAALLRVLQALSENPGAPPLLLKRLFGLSHSRVRDAVTENPNAPLVELFSQGNNTGVEPERLLRNPAFPLLLVERPDFFHMIPQWLAADFLRASSCTVEILQALSEHPDPFVHVAIAEHPLVTPALLEQLSKSADSRVRSNVAKNQATPEAALLKLAKENDVSVHRLLVKNPNTPEEGLVHLARSVDGLTKESLAQNPKSTEELLDALTKDKSLPILRLVLAHPKVSPKTLHSLAQDRRKALILLLARHPKLSLATFELLSKSDNWQVLRELKRNPATPQPIREKVSAELTKKK